MRAAPELELPSERRRWNALIDVVTVLWLLLFLLWLLGRGEPLVAWLLDLLLVFFVTDLVMLYWWEGGPPLRFARRNWLAILVVLPFFRWLRLFRIFRVARAARVLQGGRLAQLGAGIWRKALRSLWAIAVWLRLARRRRT